MRKIFARMRQEIDCLNVRFLNILRNLLFYFLLELYITDGIFEVPNFPDVKNRVVKFSKIISNLN